jgi:Na+/H+-translocating membrane pyrophosphatase
MGVILRLCVAWLLLRLIRPLLAVAVIAGAWLALQAGHARVNSSAASTLERGAAAAAHELPRALEHTFQPRTRQP